MMKTDGYLAKRTHPDQTLRSAASDQNILFAQTYLSQYLGLITVSAFFASSASRLTHKALARGYKTSFILNSAEHETSPANKSQITINCKFFLNRAEH